MIKISNKLGIEGNYLHIIKVIHEKHIANIILNGERWKTFPLRPEQSKDACFHHFHTTWNQQFQPLDQARKRNKKHPNWKGKGKWSLFTDSMIVHLKNSKIFRKKLLEIIN